MRELTIYSSSFKEAETFKSELACDNWTFPSCIKKKWSWIDFRFYYTFKAIKE